MRVRIDDAGVIASLRRVRGSVAGEKIEAALVAGALLPMNRAKALAHVITGTLRRSIHIGGWTQMSPDFAQGGASPYSDIGGNKHGEDNARIFVGTNVAYGRREEFGFIGTDSLGRTFNQPPHPYLRPAFDDQESIDREVKAALDDLVLAAA